MICKGDPFLDLIPSVTATIKSRAPNAFHPGITRLSLLDCPISKQVTGIASTPVTKSPQPATYGKGPPAVPSCEQHKQHALNADQVQGMSSGIGIASSSARGAGAQKPERRSWQGGQRT